MEKKLYEKKEFYECSFCKDLWESEEEMIEHSKECLYNPEYETALTCKHFRQYEIVPGLYYYHDIVSDKAVMPDEFRTFYHTEGNPKWELADLSEPIATLTEEEAERIRNSQEHQLLKAKRVEPELEN
jgi:hypothetical protein